VPTATAPDPAPARRFALAAVAGSLGIFGLLRLTWIEAHVVLPLTGLQAALAVGVFGAPAAPVEVTLACSGTDVLALCLGAVLAYPVAWRARLMGAAGGVVLVLGLNTLRIGTLGWLAASPAWFDAVHVYVWPGALTLGVAAYVLAWMRRADRGPGEARRRWPPQPSRRFVVLTVAFVLVFAVVSPLFAASSLLPALAAFVVRAAAATLTAAGVSATAAADVLWTSRGGFLVTQECLATPLIPIYLAAVCACATTWPRMLMGIGAACPLFVALGIARLLVVALPGVAESPTFFVHAFYQLILGVVVVCLAARWRHGAGAAPGHALAGIAVGVVVMILVSPAYAYARGVTDLGGAPLDDPQGAIAFLPAFQVGLYLALGAAASGAVGWSRLVSGLAVLGASQAAGLLALHALAAHTGLTAHVRDVRGWAVAGPVLIFAVVVHVARARR
jgi:exosortase/archaeosortase family protein